MASALTDAVAVEAILDDTRVGVWQFDVATRQLTASDAATVQLSGVTPQALRGAWRRIARQASRQPQFEVELPWTDGTSRRWLMLRGRRDPQRQQISGMCVDMTRRVRAELLVREQAVLLDTLARGIAPRDCLAVLLQAVDRLKPGLRTAILSTPASPSCNGYAIGHGMAEELTSLLQRAPTGPLPAGFGMSGDASTLDESARAWARQWQDAAQPHGIRACAALPVSKDGQAPHAWLVMCLADARDLSGWEQEVAGFTTRLATLVLEREQQHAALEQAADAVGHALHDAERERRRFKAFLDSSPDLAYVFNLEHRFTYANRALLQMWGKTEEEALGRNCLELGYPDWHAAMHSREIEEVIATRQPIRGDVPFEGPLGRRMYDYIFVPQLGLDGQVEAIVGTTRDVTERSEHEAERARSESLLRMLVDELQHRTRNIMSVVRAMASRTLATSSDLVDFSSRFDARLDALARAQGLLSRLGELDRVHFDTLLRGELAAHVDLSSHGSQILLDGPADIALRSGTVQPLAMALHELATNAVKYGALRQQGGMLHVRWSVMHVDGPGGGGLRLLVEWEEHGVADLPEDPTQIRGGGAGRELIEKALPYQVGARVEYAFAPDGLRCSILLAISQQQE